VAPLEDANLTETLEHYDAVAAHSLGGASSRVSQFALAAAAAAAAAESAAEEARLSSEELNSNGLLFRPTIPTNSTVTIKGLFFPLGNCDKIWSRKEGNFRLELANERASYYYYCYCRRMWKFNDPE